MKKIYAFTGNMGSGKTTFANMLQEKLNPGISGLINPKYQITNFANPITESVNAFFPNASPKIKRKAKQRLGEVMREIDPLVWINYSFKDNGCKIFDDLRHINESERIIKENGMIVYLFASEALRMARIAHRDAIKITDEDWKLWHEHESEKCHKIYQKYKDHPNFIFIKQINDNVEKNFNEIVNKLKI